jgi:hypothetical protein
MTGGDQLRGGRRQQDQGRVDGAHGAQMVSASARSTQAWLLSAPCGLTWLTRTPSSAAMASGRRFARRAGSPVPSASATWRGGRSCAGRGSSGGRRSKRRAPCQGAASPHDVRVAGVAAAGYVGRIDDGEHGGVVAHGPGAVALAEVGIEVNRRGIDDSVDQVGAVKGGEVGFGRVAGTMVARLAAERLRGFLSCRKCFISVSRRRSAGACRAGRGPDRGRSAPITVAILA